MISVICAVYNTKPYLRRCIESVLRQTFSNIQLVLVDDGSTDGSSQIIDEYGRRDSRVRIIHQENKGLAASRNVGLSLAKYDLVYFIDSDDYIHRDTLEILLSNMYAYDADISIGGLVIGNSPNKDLPEQINNDPRGLSSLQALHIVVDSIRCGYRDREFVPVCATWNKIFKKSLFDNIKFPEGQLHEDNATVHRLLYAAKRIVLTHAETYFWTRRNGSITARGIKDEDMVAAFEDRIAFFKEVGLTELLPLTYQRFRDVLNVTYMNTKNPKMLAKMNELDYTADSVQLAKSQPQYKVIGLFYPKLTSVNGITSWIHDFIVGLRDKYCIEIYVNEVNNRIRMFFNGLATVIRVESDKQYKCDVLINNCPIVAVPTNLAYDKLYNMVHCDYANFRDKDDKEFDPNLNYIAVSDIVAKNMERQYGIKCDYVEGLFVEYRPATSKVLHLVSATRFTHQKGFDQFVKFADMLKANNILFEWRIYSESGDQSDMPCPEMIKMPPVSRSTLMNYIADADYLVQLSQCEGFCYAVHESLLMKTPVIVSDIPVFRKYVKDGINGYIVPKDCIGFDANRLLIIPNQFTYDQHFGETKDRWISILGD